MEMKTLLVASHDCIVFLQLFYTSVECTLQGARYHAISDSYLIQLQSLLVLRLLGRHYFKSGNIPRYGQILPHLCSSPMISMKFDCHREEALLEEKYFTGSMPLPTPNHSPKTCGGQAYYAFFSNWDILKIKPVYGSVCITRHLRMAH